MNNSEERYFFGKNCSKQIKHRKILVTILSISVLGTLAFTHPILSLPLENFEFFTVCKTTPLQFIIFTLIISIIPALLIVSALFISAFLEYIFIVG